MTLWCNALLYQAVLQVHCLFCFLRIYCSCVYTWPLFQNEPDCPDYPTERFTVDVDGVQVADLTADAVQSLAINHTNGLVTLSLPLNHHCQRMQWHWTWPSLVNTVPTNRSDNMGNIAWWARIDYIHVIQLIDSRMIILDDQARQ